MTSRTNLGKANARNSARARRRGGDLASIADALGLTLGALYPMWDLRFADGRIVQQRGSDGPDAARRWAVAHPDEARPSGTRETKQKER